MSTTTTTPTTKLIKADHEIMITLDGSNAVPGPIPPMAVGQTVLYKSNDGKVRIEFPDQSPFRTDKDLGTSVPGGLILTLQSGSDGGFLECRCFLTLPNGQEVGWSNPTNLASGGQHKVTPP
jgi:hypothetical protein